jgi:hypothetical protein
LVLFWILESLIDYDSRDCAWISFCLYVGWILLICVFWIAISTMYFFMHPIDSHHNTTFFLKLTRSNISLWCYFWIDFCLNIFRNMLSGGFQHSVRQRALWKTDQCWNHMFQRSQILDHLSRGFLSADDQFRARRLKWLKIFSLWFPSFRSKKPRWLKFKKYDILRFWFSLMLIWAFDETLYYYSCCFEF